MLYKISLEKDEIKFATAPHDKVSVLHLSEVVWFSFVLHAAMPDSCNPKPYYKSAAGACLLATVGLTVFLKQEHHIL